MDGPISRLFGLLPAAFVGGLLAAVTVAGAADPAGATGATASSSGGPATQGAFGTTTQGAFGTVAAVAGTSMEVQNQGTGQVTVNWTSSTTFTQEATVSASSVATGDCVTATGSSSKGKITAQAVSISVPPPSGSCDAGPSSGSSNAPGPSGSSGAAPVRISGAPPGGSQQVVAPPGGQAVRGAGALGVAGGKVLSVSGSRLVLSGFSSTAAQKTSGQKTSGKGPTKTATSRVGSGKRLQSGKPQVVSVSLSSTTTYTETQPAAGSDLAVGDCVVANGPAADNGSVTAKAVQITATGGKSCTAGPAVRVSGGNVPVGGSVHSEQISG